MDTCDDWVKFDGSLNHDQLDKAFQEHQRDLSIESGQSYSGRLNMCRGLVIHHNVLNSYNEANEFIIKKMKKWEAAIAVKYVTSAKFVPDAGYSKLESKLETLSRILRNYDDSLSYLIENKLKSIEFIKCNACKSRLDTRFRTKNLTCPVCDASFLSQSQLNKRESIKTRIKELHVKIQNRAKVLQEKADKKLKNKQTKWLIGGLCSS